MQIFSILRKRQRKILLGRLYEITTIVFGHRSSLQYVFSCHEVTIGVVFGIAMRLTQNVHVENFCILC